MSDRFRSEDDNAERASASSEGDPTGGPANTVADESAGGIRPVTEPPKPGSVTTGRSVPPAPPAPFADWIDDWEDVRTDGIGTEELPRVELDDPPNVVDRPPVEPESVPIPPGLGEDDEPTEPNPAANISRPPPLRSVMEAAAAPPRPVLASRPRPVSDHDEPASLEAGAFSTFATDGPNGPVDLSGSRSSRVANDVRRTTSRTVRLGGLDVTVDATQRAMLITAAAGMVVVAGLFAYLLSGLGGQTEAATRQAGSELVADSVSPNLNVSASSPAAPSTSELAKATVRIAGLDEAGQTICAGSGILVGEEGVILTNAHVVTADDDCPFSSVAVGITLNTSDPPELRYRGEVLVVDAALDLAVVRIVGLLVPEGSPEIEPNFPVAKLGDSDRVDLGDTIRILGYPVIGGVTITQTTGIVAGFVAEEPVGNRALIKTDASISAGNSGGMAVNAAGEVVGIPTRAGANEAGPPVDCREVSDTNDDGRVDDGDACVPIGGFLNSIRPINLARDLLARAEAMQPESGPVTAGGGSFDLSKVSFWNPRFSLGVEADSPVDQVLTLTAGVEEICLFVDWSGLPNGVPWAAVWSHNGNKVDEFSIFKVWNFGESGRNFWYCAEDRRGHPAGVYEIGVFLDDQLAFAESIELTEDPVEIYEVTWVNKSDQDLCGLAVNPMSFSRHAGVNMFERGRVMRPGESYVTELPTGEIVAEAYDCNGMAVAVELDGLSIPDSLLVDDELVPLVIGGTTVDSDGG